MKRRLLYISNKFREADAAVSVAEDLITQQSKDDAQELVDDLPNGKQKRDLQARLNAIVIDTTPPSAPTNLRISEVNGTVPKLSWNASTDNIGVAGYNLYANGIKFNGSIIVGTDYNVTELDIYKGYNVHVRAVDAKGNLSAASNFIILLGRPPKPTNLTATVYTTSLSLSWSFASVPGNTSFQVYRKKDSCDGNDYQLVGTVTSSFSDHGLSGGTLYCYYVIAVNDNGYISNQSEPSDKHSWTTNGVPDTTPPSAPGNVQVINITYDEGRVTWDASTDNVAVRGYAVYQLISGIWLQMSSESTDLFHDLQNIGPGLGDNPNEYTIRVRAFDTSGNYADSAQVTFETWSAPGTKGNITISNLSNTSVKIDWTGAVPGTFALAGYNVYLNEVKLNTSLITATEYTFVDLLPGTEYIYHVECVDINGRSTGAPGTAYGAGSQFTTTGTAPASG